MKENEKYFNIQIFRVIASLGVLTVHMGQRLEVGGVVRRITDIGANGVYIFFIISGFVACVSTEKYDFNFKDDRVQYYKMRFVRLIPLYYCVILYYFLVHTFVWKDVPLDEIGGLGWLRYIFFLNIFIPYDNNFWGNIGATWTMNVFALFYVLFPMIRKYANNYLKSVLVCCMLYFIKNFDIPYIVDTSIDSLWFFMLGVVSYYACKEKKEKMTGIILCTSLLICYVANIRDGLLIFCLAFSVIMMMSFSVGRPSEKFQRIVNKMDKYSYDLYLVHAVFIELIDKYKEYIDLNGLGVKIVIILIGIFGSCIGSVLVHNLIERPLQTKLMKKLL